MIKSLGAPPLVPFSPALPLRMRHPLITAASAAVLALTGACLDGISSPSRAADVSTILSSSSFRAGDSITVTVAVQNTSVDPINIAGATRTGTTWSVACEPLFVVRDRAGAVVGPGRQMVCPAGPVTVTPLEGGQTATFVSRWRGESRSASGAAGPALAPGDYEVLARVSIAGLGTVDGVALPVRIVP